MRLIDADVLKTLFDVRYDTAFIQERTRENKEQWNGYCTGINWGRNTIADAPTVDALIPPVKPWDKVWIICKTLDHEKGGLKKTICEGEIFKLSYNGFTTPMEWIDYRWDSPLVGQTTSHDRIDLCLGKTVFLTREEAEAALAKMG